MRGSDSSRRCTAMLSDRSRRCRNRAIRGGFVCSTHGGAAPQVKRAARERLEALVEPAIEALRAALNSRDITATLRAAQLVLDRSGYGPTKGVNLVDPRKDYKLIITLPDNGRARDSKRRPR